jgi:hypothetical protein
VAHGEIISAPIALQELRHALDYLCALLVVAATPLGAEEQKQTASARSGPNRSRTRDHR